MTNIIKSHFQFQDQILNLDFLENFLPFLRYINKPCIYISISFLTFSRQFKLYYIYLKKVLILLALLLCNKDSSNEDYSNEDSSNEESESESSSKSFNENSLNQNANKNQIPLKLRENAQNLEIARKAWDNIDKGAKPSENPELAHLQNKKKYASDLAESKDAKDFLRSIISKTMISQNNLKNKITKLLFESQAQRNKLKESTKSEDPMPNINEVLQNSLKRKRESSVEASEESSTEPFNKRSKGSTIDFIREKESEDMPDISDSGE
jgi:hypothetical protein